jgi:uncharacterized protein YbbC (DUF1343 family)
MSTMLLGSDVLFERQLLRGRSVGIVCNPASIDANFRHIVHRAEASDVTVTAIFGPQHGLNSDLQENMIETAHGATTIGTVRRREVPVYSLYSETREPTADMLRGLDALVIDLQDVGTRIYTYIYTMANCLRAGARHGLPIIVCDRPNPIGGVAVEGPMLEPGYESFVGQFPIPMRHGMTIGELAVLFNDHFGIGAKLEVVCMRGWDRADYMDDADMPWVLPSPNIPTLDAAITYPGTVLFEGTNVSEGRGTTKPFELLGAPWVRDADAFADALNAEQMPGVHFRAHAFEPVFHKGAGRTCGGVQMHIVHRRQVRAVETGVVLIDAFRRADPSAFAWREPPYEYEYVKPPIDILFGSDRLRKALEAGVSPRELADGWLPGVAEFMKLRERFLLYETA